VLGILALVLPWAAIIYLVWTKKKAGACLLDLGNPYRFAYYLCAGVFLLVALATIPVVRAFGLGWLFYTVFFLTFAVLFLVDGSSSRALTEKGVLLPRQLIRWRRISSYRWEGESNLILSMEGGRFSGSRQKLRIKPGLKEAAEKILRERLHAVAQ